MSRSKFFWAFIFGFVSYAGAYPFVGLPVFLIIFLALSFWLGFHFLSPLLKLAAAMLAGFITHSILFLAGLCLLKGSHNVNTYEFLATNFKMFFFVFFAIVVFACLGKGLKALSQKIKRFKP